MTKRKTKKKVAKKPVKLRKLREIPSKKGTASTRAAISMAAKSVANGTVEPETKPEPTERIQGTPSQREDASNRTRECMGAIDEVLKRFRCRIVPYLNPELKMVGGSPSEPSSEGVVTCSYGVAPLV